MAAITDALEKNSVWNPVFYEDEVDIDLNPKIGADWQNKGEQKRVPTPAKNEKHYLARSLHAGTERVDYVSGKSKNSELFIRMSRHLKSTYRRAKTITLIADDYIIHKSKRRWNGWRETLNLLLFISIFTPDGWTV